MIRIPEIYAAYALGTKIKYKLANVRGTVLPEVDSVFIPIPSITAIVIQVCNIKVPAADQIILRYLFKKGQA